jgi:hypothetical protein
MSKQQAGLVVVLAGAFLAGFAARGVMPGESVAHAQGGARVFELRTYTAAEGKLGDLNARFRNHTMKLFQKHGITNIGYWVPQDAPKSQNTLVYVIAHPSREAAKMNWAAFGKDPDWQKAAAESGVGRVQVESVFMEATDYSPLK